MRAESDRKKILKFMDALALQSHGNAKIYLVGGASALLMQWRDTTIDIDIKADPEPEGFFEAIAYLKDHLDTNIELASPDLFLPELPEWRDRSIFIKRVRDIDYFHYDFYAQALSKIQRGHTRDLADVVAMYERQLIKKNRLRFLFDAIAPQLIRYPSIDSQTFTQAVYEFCKEKI